MAMTKEEYDAWAWAIEQLRDGYAPYADVLTELHFNLTDDPSVSAYLSPSTATITVNRGFDEKQVLVVIRHEIMHQFLKHEIRLIKHVAKIFNLNPDDLLGKDIDAIKNFIYSTDIFNIAADFEISNLTYGDYEKEVCRNLILNGEVIKALVTEGDPEDPNNDKNPLAHPDWVDLSLEEMYDKLIGDQLKNSMVRTGNLVDETTFVDEEGNVYGLD